MEGERERKRGAGTQGGEIKESLYLCVSLSAYVRVCVCVHIFEGKLPYLYSSSTAYSPIFSRSSSIKPSAAYDEVVERPQSRGLRVREGGGVGVLRGEERRRGREEEEVILEERPA